MVPFALLFFGLGPGWRFGTFWKLFRFLEAITFAGDLDDFRPMEKSVENRRRAGDIADQLAPIIERSIARHHGRTELVSAHDDLEQVFTGSLRQLLHSHVVDDQQVGLQIALEEFLVSVHRLVVKEISDRIKDRSVVHRKSRTDRGNTN